MSIDQLLMYIFVIFSVSIAPGPSMILAFKDGAAYRLSGTIPAALGNMTASLIQAMIAFLAFHSIISVTPQAQGIVQVIGAGFIIYIGYTFIRNGRNMQIGPREGGAACRPSHKRFADGFLVAVFNPKAIMFFIALFPQFTSDMNVASLMDMVQTFTPIGLIALLCFMIYGLLGQYSHIFFNDRQIFGIVIPALGVLMICTAIFVTVRLFLPGSQMFSPEM